MPSCPVRPLMSAPLLSLALKFPVGVLAAIASLRIIAPDWLARVLTTAARIRSEGIAGRGGSAPERAWRR